MVATSLPFWMQHSGRSMSPFFADPALRLGSTVSPAERRGGVRGVGAIRTEQGLFVERCGAPAMATYESAWIALAQRALEPNVFLEPGFALPALRHFPPAQRPSFLLVWRREGGERAALVGLLALKARDARFGGYSTSWSHEQATGNLPLLDRDHAGPVLDLMLESLAAARGWSGLTLQGVPLDGAFAGLLRSRGHVVQVVEQRTRSVLRRDGEATTRSALPKPIKELRRQRRRLEEDGVLGHSSAQEPGAVKLATEQFLHLEAQGWKGARGTALLRSAGLAAFTRALTRQLARTGQCRIDALTLDGVPVAMGIVLRSGDRAFFWKTAFDEAWKRHSPGKQLADLIGETQAADRSLALTDSCAVPDHPMIDHVWRDRMVVGDLLVAPATVDPALTRRAVRLLSGYRRGRALIKRAAQMVLGG